MAQTWGTRAKKSGFGKGWSFWKLGEVSSPQAAHAPVRQRDRIQIILQREYSDDPRTDFLSANVI